MPTLTTSVLTNAIGARYTQRYLKGAQMRRIYDQFALPIGAMQADLEGRKGLGTSYIFNFLSHMAVDAQTMSETTDLVPQILRDATSSITPTSRGGSLRWTELLDLEVFTNFVAERAGLLGENAMETLEALCIDAALAGSIVYRAEARATLDSVDTGSHFTEAALWTVASMVQDLKFPMFVTPDGRSHMIAIAHPDVYYDLFHGGNVASAIQYGGLPGEILLNGELGEIAGFKLVISPYAKVFGAAGEDNDTATFAESPSVAVKALDKTITFATGTNSYAGRYLTVGTEETGDTFYPGNERVKWISGTTTTTIVGSGDNGGMHNDHPVSDVVRNADSVYPVLYGGPGSLVKVFANEVGEFGEVVGPKKEGTADQWTTLAWKFYGGYGRVAENRLARGEYSSSLDDVA